MKTKRLGFSLIEMIVAITIGGIILGSVMGSFLSLSRMRQQLDLTRQIQREINFAVIRIADRIRSQEIDHNEIDYSINTEKLQLGENAEIIFKTKETNGIETLMMNDDPLFSSNLKVDQLTFTVFPTTETPTLQPRVTIKLQVSDIHDKTSVPLRTTISSRLIE